MHRVLTYFGSIFNEIIIKFLMLVFDMKYLDLIVKRKIKSTGTFGLYFSCFEPFWVWGVIVIVPELAYDSIDFEDKNWFWSKTEH